MAAFCIGFFGKTERIFRSKRNLPTIRFFRMDPVTGACNHIGARLRELAGDVIAVAILHVRREATTDK